MNSLWFRLLLGFAVPLVSFLGAACVSFYSVQRLLSALEQEQLTQAKLTEIFEAMEGLEAMAVTKQTHFLVAKSELARDFERQRQAFNKDVNDLESLFAGDAAQLQRLAEVRRLEEEWYAQTQQNFKLWARRPREMSHAELQQWLAKLDLQAGLATLQRMRVATRAMASAEQDELARQRGEVRARTMESVWAIVAALIISVGFSVTLTQVLWRGISRPIQRLRAAVHTMRQGRYEAINPFGPTEIAELIRGFNLMGLALSERTTLLESSELRYRTVVGTIAGLVWTTDAQGRIAEMNNWCTLTGQKPEEIADDGWLGAVHPDDRERFARHWRRVIDDKTYAEEEIRIRRADGSYGNYVCRSVPIFDPRGQVVEWVRSCADITERRREEELRRQKDAAEAANRAKSEFLTKMSHELRTPLNAIIGMSKMLRTRRFGSVNDKQLDYLTDITQAGEHLLSLINDILDLSRVESGHLELKMEPVPVNATVEQVVSTVRALAERKALRLQTDLCAPEGTVFADPARLRQVLYNLLSNAVKFTPPGGTVSVHCAWVDRAQPEAAPAPHDAAGAVRFDVVDTGIGIAPADQLKLGTEFFQARSSPHKAQEGTGLGLALSRRLVRMMGGRLWFASAVGKGSTFSFALPLRSAARSEFAAPSASGEGPLFAVPVHRPLVLIIDDHVPTNKLLADWLQEAGLQTASAYDGTTGLELARRLRPRLILLDVRLPGMSGLDVVHQLKDGPETAHIPIIVVSVLEGQHYFQELDVVDWFVKPLDKEQMIQRLQGTVPGLFAPERTVLIVEDDAQTRKWMRDMLLAEGLHVFEAGSRDEALAILEADTPDLILLDLLVPGGNGFEMVETIRANPAWQLVPIMMVTARDISAADRARLGGYIQVIFRKDNFTREKLLQRMQQLGVRPAEAAGGAQST